MESASDRRVDRRADPHIGLRLLLEIAHAQSVELAVDRVLDASLSLPSLVAVQFWLVKEGDRCSTCTHRMRCPDQTYCLHLFAGMGKSPGEERPSRGGSSAASSWGNPSERMPLGAGLFGEAAAKQTQILVEGLPQDRQALMLPTWTAQEEVRSVGVTPIVFKGELLGVLVGYSRGTTMEMPLWARAIADHLGAAVANARAFEEIQRLKAQLEQQNAYLQEEVVEARAFGDLVGQSAALRQIVTQIDLVAPTEATVLILGETGTGKELVAREIHLRSKRRERPLIRVNCASIPKDLFESEFFGHVKGAFTGALKDRAGRFEAAEGGTIFLDEIGEVPLEMQAHLLRVLQEKRYERVGDDRTRRADVRIIAATNRDLKKAVETGSFREDLYYCLNVFPIQVMPLRERIEDIPLLAQHFIALSCKELGCPQPRLTQTEAAKLQQYHWPGNVRELRNVIERAVILAHGQALKFDLAPTMPAEAALTSSTHAEPSRSPVAEPEFLTEAEMQQRERENLLVVLRKTRWKIKGAGGAAELLGIKPTTLLSRMAKWGLHRPPSANS